VAGSVVKTADGVASTTSPNADAELMRWRRWAHGAAMAAALGATGLLVIPSYAYARLVIDLDF
jgi:hypothetical protein